MIVIFSKVTSTILVRTVRTALGGVPDAIFSNFPGLRTSTSRRPEGRFTDPDTESLRCRYIFQEEQFYKANGRE